MTSILVCIIVQRSTVPGYSTFPPDLVPQADETMPFNLLQHKGLHFKQTNFQSSPSPHESSGCCKNKIYVVPKAHTKTGTELQNEERLSLFLSLMA
jgi:hypothetical protein